MCRLLLMATAVFSCGALSIAAEQVPPVESVAGQSIEQHARRLEHPDRTVRLIAARSLGVLGAPAGDVLQQALRHEDPAIRYVVAVHLGRIGGQPLEQAKHTLQQLVNDQSSLAVRIAASYALCCSGEVDQHLPWLITALDHPQRGVACSAAELIGQIGPSASPALDALNQTYKNNQPGRPNGDSHLSGAVKNAIRKIANMDATRDATTGINP